MGYPLCEVSLKEGKIRRGSHCDHIKPIAEGGAKLDKVNLQWLSPAEHAKKTHEENPENASNFRK